MFDKVRNLPANIKQYLVITTNYWFFTLTDGALRMLVVLYFHQLGYQPLAIALLFLFYEAFGVITNLIGGWLGARIGLNKTMNIGLGLQVMALLMLALPSEMLTVIWVMFAQALSGIAKDLNKMSAKSSIKALVVDSSEHTTSPLFKWVALLTGSKNALKGVGFFLGGFLLATFGFQQSMLLMAAVLMIVVCASLILLNKPLGQAKSKPKFTEIFSRDATLNYLAAARLCLFAARDVWFVVALPIFLNQTFQWSYQQVGAFLALWVIAYGLVQAKTPKLITLFKCSNISGRLLSYWAFGLSLVTAVIAASLYWQVAVFSFVIGGLLLFGAIFAINSSLHSYLVVSLAKEDGVSMDVGFYYMANAMGRLLGTVLSGWLFQQYGLAICLMVSVLLAASSAVFIRKVNPQ